MPKKRKRSPEQLKIAGTERLDRIPKLDELAESYRDIDDQYHGLKEERDDLGEQLVEELEERKLELAELKVKVTIRRFRQPRVEAPSTVPSTVGN